MTSFDPHPNSQPHIHPQLREYRADALQFIQDVVGMLQNLIVLPEPHHLRYVPAEHRLVQTSAEPQTILLRDFVALKILLIADRVSNQEEVGDELVWLRNAMKFEHQMAMDDRAQDHDVKYAKKGEFSQAEQQYAIPLTRECSVHTSIKQG